LALAERRNPKPSCRTSTTPSPIIATSWAAKLLEDGEHQLLLAHRAGVFDLDRFGKCEQIGRGFVLELLKLHFLHGKSKSRF
jgi:hypothetical protein